MDLALLKTFVTVAKTKNISHAAERIHLTQPAVSLQIKQLETLVGAPLFLRHPIRLTDAGEHLLPNAKAMLEQWEHTLSFVRAEEMLMRGTLTIACSDTAMRFALLETIGAFRARYPDIQLSFLNRTSAQAKEAVIQGEADIALALYEQDHPKLVHKPLLQYREVAAVEPTHALANQQSVSAQRLAKETLLLLETVTHSRQLIDQWFKSKQCTVNATMSLGSVDGQLSLADLGLGVAIVPEFSVPESLTAVSINGLPKRTLALFYQRLKPAAQAWLRVSSA